MLAQIPKVNTSTPKNAIGKKKINANKLCIHFDGALHVRPKINSLRGQNDVPNKNKNQTRLKQLRRL